jgi:hypothetical protein
MGIPSLSRSDWVVEWGSLPEDSDGRAFGELAKESIEPNGQGVEGAQPTTMMGNQ